MSARILAIDKGTSVLKVIVFDENGVALATERADGSARAPRSGWHEEDADASWSVLCGLVRKVMAGPAIGARGVDAIAVTSHMGGLVLLDGANRPLGPNLLWDDTRAGGLLEEWGGSGALDALIAHGHQALLAGLTIPLLAWQRRHDPELVARARGLCTTKDFLVLRMTGELGTDESDAAWMPSDAVGRGYSTEIWRLAGVDDLADLFPPIHPSERVVGTLLPESAEAMGLAAGIPVIAGLGDANASSLGVGAWRAGQAVTVVGTSLLNNIVTDTAVTEPEGIGFLIPHPDGRWLRMVPNTGGGSVNVQWLVDLLYRDAPDPFAVLEAEATAVEPGAGGLIYHPYINRAGVVAPFYHLGARAQFTGLHLGVGRPEMARAVLEGLAFAIRDCFSAVPSSMSEVRLTGGAARSRLLCRLVADVTGVPVVITEGEEAAALGAAIVASWGTGLHPTLESATAAYVRERARFDPDPAAHAEYSARFPLFREIRSAMADPWTHRLDFEPRS